MTKVGEDDVRIDKPLDDVWQEALALLAKQLTVPTFKMCFSISKLLSVTDTEAEIGVLNPFALQVLSKDHSAKINAALSSVLGRNISARIIHNPNLEFDSYTPSIANIAVIPAADAPKSYQSPGPQSLVASAPSSAYAFGQSRITAANLNPEQTFDTFVVGSHDRFVHSAAVAVAENPGRAYNPLFIYGGVGLGKTHILHAIGHQILLKTPSAVVRYVTCEQFLNEFLRAIRGGDQGRISFQKRYRQVDVLLMDDIQFIAGKEGTQEEFHNTFNALRDSGKQIVLSSDRPPKAMAQLEERLRSRFEWGLLADIQPPDYETRIAILRKKAELARIYVQDDVLAYIATIFTTNVRELEQALNRTRAHAELTGSTINLATVSSIFKPEIIPKAKPILTIDRILDAVASYYHVEVSDLRSASRSQDLVLARHVAMFLSQDLTEQSTTKIGKAIGDRKHSSVIHACDRIKEEIQNNSDIAHAVSQIKHQLNG